MHSSDFSAEKITWECKSRIFSFIISRQVLVIANNRKVNNKTEKGIPFTVTFYPRLKVFQNIIDKKLYLLHMNEEVKKAFTPKSVISHNSSYKISSYLV